MHIFVVVFSRAREPFFAQEIRWWSIDPIDFGKVLIFHKAVKRTVETHVPYGKKN